jgi:HK97 family phage major capsid protein
MTLSNSAILEISELSDKAERLARGSASDKAQSTVLLQRITNIRTIGISSDEMRAKYGTALVESINPKQLTEERYRKAFHSYLMHGNERELRDLIVGTQSISWTAGPQGGFTVPIETEKQIFEALAQTDPLLDESVCHFTMENTPTLQPKFIRGFDLSTITASLVGETVQQTASAFPTVAGRLLRGNLIYKISVAASWEAEDDVPEVLAKFARAYGVAFARKLGADAINGNGTTQPQGILTALPTPVYTTGAGKLVYSDFTSIFFAVNKIYRDQPKCAWLMNDKTYQRVRNSTDNNGRPLLDILFDGFPSADGSAWPAILGRPVYICPSIAGDLSASNSTIVFGDLDHFHIRCSRPTVAREVNASIKDITQGLALYVGRVRMDSALFDPSSGSAPPLVTATVTV